MEMGYLTVLHVGLGAKIGDLHAKDSHSFCNKQMFQPSRWGRLIGVFAWIGGDPRFDQLYSQARDVNRHTTKMAMADAKRCTKRCITRYTTLKMLSETRKR